jgi:hypothetical protein
MARRKLGMTDEQWAAYKARVDRRIATQKKASSEGGWPKPHPQVVPKKVEVDVGVMKATVTAGPDGKFGTPDDKATLTPKNKKPFPRYDKKMSKKDLLKVADEVGVTGLTKRNNKAEMVEAIQQAEENSTLKKA